MVDLVVKLTRPKNTREESRCEDLSTLGWLMGISSEFVFIKLIDVGRLSSLWASSAVGTQDLDAPFHELEHEACYGTDVADYGPVLVTIFHAFSTHLAVSKEYNGCFLTTCVMFGMLLQLFQPHLLLEEQRSLIISCQTSPLVIGFCILVL